MPDYDEHPLEIYEEKTWVVHDPWTAQDIAIFSSEDDAEKFKKYWEDDSG